MQKIDIICRRYELTQKDNYIKLDDIINNVLRKDRIEKILKNIDKDVIILNNEKYVTKEIFKDLCNTNKWYKTNEINYMLNTDIDFQIINFEDKVISIIIKDNIKYYRLFDLGTILNYKWVSKVGKILNKDEIYLLKDLIDTKICTIFGTEPNTHFSTENGVKKLLLKSRKDFDTREKLAKQLDIKINLHTDKFLEKETQNLTFIKNCLPDNTNIIFQHFVKDGTEEYYIDMYLPDYNIAIECDEFGHTKYDKNKEEKREQFIKDKLKCDIIRFNPDMNGFTISTVIREIYDKILSNQKKIKVKSKEKKVDIIIDDIKDNKNNIKKDDEIDKNKKIEKPIKSQKTNKCIDCDAEIYYGNQRCTYCMNKKKFEDNCKEKDRPSKEQLLKDIGELGYTGSGKKYGVSDNCIRKWIKRYDKFNL